MSDLLRIAAALRQASDDELRQIIAQRMVNTSGLLDFFDLASSLSQPKSIASAVASLSKRQIDALVAMLNGSQPEHSVAEDLRKLMLIDSDQVGRYSVFDSTAEHVRTLEPANLIENEPNRTPAPTREEIDRDSGVATFETLQALTELIFDAEQRYIREVGKKNVGLPDIKRLAQHIRQPNEFAREIYELANHADLISLANGRWQLGPKASVWLNWQPAQRHAHLMEIWYGLLGASSAQNLLLSIEESREATSLVRHLRENYPYADGLVSSRINRIVSYAERLGLAHTGWLSSWGLLALDGKFEAASALSANFLPIPQRRLICQADLSLITPGPLPTDLEIALRKFADTEQIGMASTYRLSALSLSHGLETGMTETDIRVLLLELTEKPLPQPVDYLIREAAQRFGRLTVSAGELETKGLIKSLDSNLLAQILNDNKLKSFVLYAMPDGSIGCRFEPEMLYFGLREASYSAIRTDSNGEVISPRAPMLNSNLDEMVSTVTADIRRMRAQEEKLGVEPDGDDLVRSIQLAIKNKAIIVIGVVTNSGDELEFILEPIGFANGRLRAKDKKADIERTLPLSSITRVALG